MMMNEEMPDVVVIWSNQRHARNEYVCEQCGETIAKGEAYRSTGAKVDGLLHHHKTHGPSYADCPKWREAERQELQWQFERDQQRYFPQDTPPHD